MAVRLFDSFIKRRATFRSGCSWLRCDPRSNRKSTQLIWKGLIKWVRASVRLLPERIWCRLPFVWSTHRESEDRMISSQLLAGRGNGICVCLGRCACLTYSNTPTIMLSQSVVFPGDCASSYQQLKDKWAKKGFILYFSFYLFAMRYWML